MFSSTEKQESPDLSDISRMIIPLHFKSNGEKKCYLSFLAILCLCPQKAA